MSHCSPPFSVKRAAERTVFIRRDRPFCCLFFQNHLTGREKNTTSSDLREKLGNYVRKKANLSTPLFFFLVGT